MDGRPVDPESAGSGYAGSTRADPTRGDVQARGRDVVTGAVAAKAAPTQGQRIDLEGVSGHTRRLAAIFVTGCEADFARAMGEATDSRGMS